MKRQPLGFSWKRFGKKAVTGVVLAELFGVLACYVFYRKTNRDPEFRYILSQNSIGSGILEGYYKLGETLNSEIKIRDYDKALWKQQGKSV